MKNRLPGQDFPFRTDFGANLQSPGQGFTGRVFLFPQRMFPDNVLLSDPLCREAPLTSLALSSLYYPGRGRGAQPTYFN